MSLKKSHSDQYFNGLKAVVAGMTNISPEFHNFVVRHYGLDYVHIQCVVQAMENCADREPILHVV